MPAPMKPIKAKGGMTLLLLVDSTHFKCIVLCLCHAWGLKSMCDQDRYHLCLNYIFGVVDDFCSNNFVS